MKQASTGKLIGAVLLIIGTSIGGGMLALPVANAASGFVDSSIALLLCWMLMTFCALLILEVNLWLPAGSNMVSMAEATLGRYGRYVTWFFYLLLLYTLLSGYISGGTDVIDSLFEVAHIHSPLWIDSLFFVLLLGTVVYFGIKSVDYVNRGLMFGKLGVYCLLVFLLLPNIHLPKLSGGDASYVVGSLMVLATSFGFATVVPSIRAYFDDDVKSIRKVVFLGSFIPLICYIIWDAAIMGVVPRHGEMGLIRMTAAGHSTSDLTKALIYFLHNDWVTDFFRLFISLSMLTAFLGVSLGLTDFLADGLKRKKRGREAILVYAIAFLPPLVLVFYKPYMFLVAMSFAGVCCIVLLVLLPALMIWRGRYVHGMSGDFKMPGGKPILAVIIVLAIGIAMLGVVQSLKLI